MTIKSTTRVFQKRMVQLINDFLVNNGDVEELLKLLSGMVIILESTVKMAKSIHYLKYPNKNE